MSADLGVDLDNVSLEARSAPVRAPVCHDPAATSRAMVHAKRGRTYFLIKYVRPL